MLIREERRRTRTREASGRKQIDRSSRSYQMGARGFRYATPRHNTTGPAGRRSWGGTILEVGFKGGGEGKEEGKRRGRDDRT